MLRLFIVRILNKTHPFKGDLNHFHHIVDSLTKNKELTAILTISASILPTIFLFLNVKTYYILFFTLIFYFGVLTYSRLKK